MNLLNKKLEEKLNLYDDKSNNDNEINKYKPTKNLKTSNNNNSDFLQKIKEPTNNYFDKIYSDFFLFQNKIHINNKENENEHSSFNDINEKKMFENKKLNKALKNKEKTDNNKRKNNLNLNSNKNIYFYKMNIPYSDKNNFGERLYNNSFITKTKIENQRKMRDDDFKKNLIPKISLKAKQVKFEKKRLYNDNINKKIRKNASQKNRYEKDKTFSFKPILNKKSLKIAEKLEPFTYRINKKKCKINKSEIFDLTKKNYSNLFTKINKDNDTHRQNKNRSTENRIKKIDEFYRKQIEKIKIKEKIYNENKLNKEEEYKKYPFHPIINKKSLSLNKTFTTNEHGIKNTFERLYKTNKTCTKTNNLIKNKEIKINEICTFKPEITPLNIKDDEKMIRSNINQNNYYIVKRRKNLEELKNFEKYKNKKFGNIYGLFKPVISSKDNGLRTERRHTSKGDKSINKDEGNNNKYIITKGTVDFNNENNTHRSEKIYYYLNDENDNMNINIIKYNNIKNDLNQKEFLDAINALHNQIDNLDI